MDIDQAAGPRKLVTVVALVGVALAVSFLFVGAAHSLILLTSGGVADDLLTITRGRWEWVAASVAVFLVFLALIPVSLQRDWRTHGVYAAFVVSLFAEMFGFPLSIYFLSSALGLTLLEARFMRYMYLIGMPLGSLISFLGVLLIVLGWREIYRARGRLATQGIYGYLRHPQHLGLLLVTAGWLVHWPTLPGLAMWPVLLLLYYRLSLREDRRLAEQFGEEYRVYAQETPLLFPRRPKIG